MGFVKGVHFRYIDPVRREGFLSQAGAGKRRHNRQVVKPLAFFSPLCYKAERLHLSA